MLRLADTQRLRRSSIQSQFRRGGRGRRVTLVFSGGPLDRVRTTVPAEADDIVYIGFCAITDHEPVQAVYIRADGRNWWFAHLLSGTPWRVLGARSLPLCLREASWRPFRSAAA